MVSKPIADRAVKRPHHGISHAEISLLLGETPRRVHKPRRAAEGRPPLCDPATCDRYYDADEAEFLSAMDRYRTRTGRKFPTLSETLGVLKSLGWAKPCA